MPHCETSDRSRMHQRVSSSYIWLHFGILASRLVGSRRDRRLEMNEGDA